MLNKILYTAMNNGLQIKCSDRDPICGDTTFTAYVIFPFCEHNGSKFTSYFS
jgi:hypothetical protein